MKKFIFIFKEVLKGKSVTRAFLNFHLTSFVLNGEVIDVGGGRNADYLSFMDKEVSVSFKTFDVKAGEKDINFETDKLPAHDCAYDTVLFLNVMEHIYNYQHIANEVVRIVKPGGQLIGFVPFLMWYHPDHRDFFRYTHEALENILKTAEAKDFDVIEIGGGPFLAASQMMHQSIPKFLRPLVFLKMYFLDYLYRIVKGSSARSYALGYIFVVNK